jgi:phage terminase large subunit-like protein
MRAGHPLELSPRQEKTIRDLFGTLGPDGRRQYRTAYREVPRKAGKSALAAVTGLYLLFEGGRWAADICSAVGDRDEAALVFEQATAMVEGSPALARVTETVRRSIVLPCWNPSHDAVICASGAMIWRPITT